MWHVMMLNNSMNETWLAGKCSSLPNQELSGAKSELPGGTVGVCSFHRRCGPLPYNLPITHLRFTPRSLQVCLLPNQELSVLYGGPTLNYGEELFLYVPYMPRVSMTGDLAHLQLSDLQGETRGRKNAYMPNVMASFPIEIILRK